MLVRKMKTSNITETNSNKLALSINNIIVWTNLPSKGVLLVNGKSNSTSCTPSVEYGSPSTTWTK